MSLGRAVVEKITQPPSTPEPNSINNSTSSALRGSGPHTLSLSRAHQLEENENSDNSRTAVCPNTGPAGRVLIETGEKTYIEDHPELNRVWQLAASPPAEEVTSDVDIVDGILDEISTSRERASNKRMDGRLVAWLLLPPYTLWAG